MNENYLAPDKLIFSTANREEKIYIREQSGFFQKIRRNLSTMLIGLFILLPFLRHHGEQAILFDIEQQKFHLFSFTLFPQDFVIFSLIFSLAAFGLFYLTKLYGRVWCGFTCPQTVWTLMFNWVERRIEGSHNQSKALDKQPLSFNKVWRKTAKHLCWCIISLFTSLVFISYFIPVEQLYLPFFTFTTTALVIGWVLFFTGCTYINAGFIREKMCQHMCPYSRFQSAMFDKSTLLVTYDNERGENRGKRKRNQEKMAEQGDCVDCDLCVQVCPAGIDIRNGLQYECINCGLCVDACDNTLNRFNYPLRLINFASASSKRIKKSQHAGYLTVICILLAATVYWAISWNSFEVNILRDRQALYRINLQGAVENTYLFKIRNKTSEIERYQITQNNPQDYQFESLAEIQVIPGELKTIAIVLSKTSDQFIRRDYITFTVTAMQSGQKIAKQVSFYAGTNAY